jgi:hypothetical protein
MPINSKTIDLVSQLHLVLIHLICLIFFFAFVICL